MFLYNNTITSESSLYIETEPTINFVEEAISYNKELISESMNATKQMIDIVAEYSDTPKAVAEAFADWKTRIIKFLKEFKARVIVLFKRWIDWIAKTLHKKGFYSDDAVKELLANVFKSSKLADFKMELSEPVDFGFTYFNELQTCAFIDNVDAVAGSIYIDRVKDPHSKHPMEINVKKIRDELTVQSKSFLCGSKKTELTLADIKALYDAKSRAADDLKKYKDRVITEIERLGKIAEHIGNASNDAFKDQCGYNAVVAVSTCLNEHLTNMANTYPEFINRINKAFAEFLPQAEQYLIANG